MACPGIEYGEGFVAGSLAFVDCQVLRIATFGYQALAVPGSATALVLTGLLTLFVALFGYRMLLGEVPSVREGVVALAKIGVVLALATSWTTYRTLAHDVVLRAPAELVATIGGAAGLPGADGGLAARLQLVDTALVQLGEQGVGPKETGERVLRVRRINGRSETVVENAQEPVGLVEPIALGLARLAFLVGAVGALAAVRLVAGILLALGPLFVAFLLFEATRGWFAGWVRGLSAAMIGVFAITLLLGVELALLEPWVATLVARRGAEDSIAGAPVELLAAMLVFALVIGVALAAAGRVAGGFRLPDRWGAVPAQVAAAVSRHSSDVSRSHDRTAASAAAAERPRAIAVADAVATTQRREAAVTAAIAGLGASVGGGTAPRTPAQALARDVPVAVTPPLGQRGSRRTRARVSASAGRRDLR